MNTETEAIKYITSKIARCGACNSWNTETELSEQWYHYHCKDCGVHGVRPDSDTANVMFGQDLN